MIRKSSNRSLPVRVALALACLSALASCSVATADRLSYQASFSLRASDGFRILALRSEGFLAVAAYKTNASAVYFTRASEAARNGFETKLGNLGEMSLHFRALGPRVRDRDAPRGCYRANVRGVFLGRLEFEGEEGYVHVKAHRIKGSVTVSRGDCDTFDRPSLRPSGVRPRLVPQEVGLHASYRHRLYSVEFACSEGAGSDVAPLGATDPDRRFFEAAIEEQRHRLAILRTVKAASDDPNSFSFDNPLTSATAAPPPPFSGSATMVRADRREKGAWNGTLAASFPGVANVPLAGPGFTAVTDFYDYAPE